MLCHQAVAPGRVQHFGHSAFHCAEGDWKARVEVGAHVPSMPLPALPAPSRPRCGRGVVPGPKSGPPPTQPPSTAELNPQRRAPRKRVEERTAEGQRPSLARAGNAREEKPSWLQPFLQARRLEVSCSGGRRPQPARRQRPRPAIPRSRLTYARGPLGTDRIEGTSARNYGVLSPAPWPMNRDRPLETHRSRTSPRLERSPGWQLGESATAPRRRAPHTTAARCNTDKSRTRASSASPLRSA